MALLAAVGLSACGLSPEAMKKARSEKLEKFASTVVEHILDKNPETLKVSITTFMRDEVNDSERDKLQQQKIIPDSPIDVERIEQENQAAGRSNAVKITSVKALTPIEKDSVKFEVVGNEVTKLKGKVTDTRPFKYELTVLLNGEMSGYPRLTDLSGFTVPAATADSSQAATGKSGKKIKQRRRG
ncbi:MAG: hypothetical protein JST01_00675 [Cyanobacteria bacterium SZAS TMP-1]|nr:hypothetical protein [Cyanobacteria bacterium SZAS TMP-1]